MTTLPYDLARTVEPGQLPRRQRFYALRREVLHSPPMRAFAIGLAVGIGATFAATIVLGLLLSTGGCAWLTEARRERIRPHFAPAAHIQEIDRIAQGMDAAAASIVFQPITKNDYPTK